MAGFEDHITQAQRNLSFLEKVNNQINDYPDWQVTICFYTALHFVNAHLSTFGLQYRRHNDVKHALNPKVPLSTSKLPEEEYIAYVTLQMLSRRSRYLVNEKEVTSDRAFFTYDKHLAKALIHLDRLIQFFNKKYNLNIDKVSVKCLELHPQHVFQHLELL